MAFREENKNDFVVLIFSLLAVIIAGTLSMATVVNKPTDSASIRFDSDMPMDKANTAAIAGSEAAKWHIECHGRKDKGSLSPQYYINGATYAVEWDEVNMSDSTVIVRAKGEFVGPDNERYQAKIETKVKLDFFPSHKKEIMSDYYAKNRNHQDN